MSDPVQIAIGGLVVATFLLVGWRVRGTVGLRRRLTVALALAALVPTMAVAALLVNNARTLLGVLDAPGLQDSVDAGLGLARAWLEGEEAALVAEARAVEAALAAGTPVPATRAAWRAGARSSGFDLAPWDLGATTADGRARRATRPEGTVLARGTRLPDGRRLDVARRVPDAIARDLVRIERGSAGFRQLDLFYRPLLATSLLTIAVVAVAALAVITTVVGRDLSRRLLRPVAELVDGTQRVAAGDLDHRVQANAVGEIAQLVDAFNGMTVRLAEGERKLRRSERLAAWQGIARRLAHEIKNPLTPIQLAVHRLRRRTDDAVALEALRAIEDEVLNLERLAEEFSALGRMPAPVPRPVGLALAVKQASQLYVPEGIRVEIDVPPQLRLHADEGQLRQVVGNLLKNAVQALEGSGRVDVSAGADGEFVRWTVEDDGPGLGDAARRVFEAGFTTRTTGSGLGLAIVQRIVEDHGGEIEAGAGRHGGARFTVDWPRATPAEGDPLDHA